MTETTRTVVTQANSRLIPNNTLVKNVPIPRARPGIVIFLHGVNDPGASYAAVETGLCQGLNERLDRNDLKPGSYGAAYMKAKAMPARSRSRREREQLDDPDTYLYRREDDAAKSVMIPFYWGYRAADTEIQREPNGDPAKVRTQYQDKMGNRLDRHFGKAGGFFANATNNLPDMYGNGFDSLKRHAANRGLPNHLYMGKAPHRRYLVLAAERLATLVSAIRSIYPSETITIMGHSQGTLITLLAQALLVDRRQRCADCVIMVASPYSLTASTTPASGDTLSTLGKIVERVTAKPYALPALANLAISQPKSYGRTGRRWSPTQGQRIGKDGNTVVFPERDNRGKVYLYFCPDDSTVGLSDVVGIGTFGVPDLVDGGRPGMNRLRQLSFYQRMWTKRHRDGKPVVVGTAPSQQLLRAKGEPRYAGGGVSAKHLIAAAAMEEGSTLWINGEELVPTHAPKMFAGESVEGSPTTRGQEHADDVNRNVALGKEGANFPWLPLPADYAGLSTDAARARFNQQAADENDRTYAVRAVGWGKGKTLEREMTPNEARVWMGMAKKALDENSYHSAMLRDPDNHRWVTAMDVAIGQGHSLDDPDWCSLLTLMADWKMTPEYIQKMQENPRWNDLEQSTRDLVEATGLYYNRGIFPPSSLVNLSKLPSLIDGSIPKGAGE